MTKEQIIGELAKQMGERFPEINGTIMAEIAYDYFNEYCNPYKHEGEQGEIAQ